MTIEETLDEVEKYWETDRTEAARVIMRYAEKAVEAERERMVQVISSRFPVTLDTEFEKGYLFFKRQILQALTPTKTDKQEESTTSN